MQQLLKAVQSQLQADLSYIRDGDIYITPHVNYIPAGVRPPCVGIKDGTIRRTELAGGMLKVELTIYLAVYVKLLKEQAAIVGDAAAGDKGKGLLEIAHDIQTALDENLLGIEEMQAASSAPDEPASEMFGDEKEALQRKIITYTYEKEELRP